MAFYAPAKVSFACLHAGQKIVRYSQNKIIKESFSICTIAACIIMLL
uniref:Uncharacterized protein n=1 Tax=Rhizophora mucronata TaxID=61149 RepID=A0A2P2LI76_RHIMU